VYRRQDEEDISKVLLATAEVHSLGRGISSTRHETKFEKANSHEIAPLLNVSTRACGSVKYITRIRVGNGEYPTRRILLYTAAETKEGLRIPSQLIQFQ